MTNENWLVFSVLLQKVYSAKKEDSVIIIKSLLFISHNTVNENSYVESAAAIWKTASQIAIIITAGNGLLPSQSQAIT